ncbi:DUF1007 family protein [uncultured Desulfosarcina sp.]|uniref:DUF1007 family protein n=1 Tax=uncultured Desulfosarcina sp. TaxID=218289 RepID=UPI0029C80637|nr:DUF1007 family protein [uncultured Desulfosarcina sp.]
MSWIQCRDGKRVRRFFNKAAWLGWVCIAFSMAMGVPSPLLSKAHAHPHVFIVQRLNLVFDEKGLAGIKVRWKMDDMFASMIAGDHDQNRNGTLEPDEVQSVRENAFIFIREFNFFTFIKIDNRPFQVKFIRDFNATLENGRLVYEFFIPCHVKATDIYKKVSVSTYDPSYYTAIFFAKKNPVALTAADAFELKTAIREDPDTKIYFDMIHPWTLFMEFRKKT